MSLRKSDCGQTVDELLLDAGHSDATELRAALISMGSLANLPAPAPSAELAALMAGPHNDLTRQRWLRKHRPAVVGIAVLTGMGLGVSGVAASSPISLASDSRVSIQDLAQDWAPGWTVPVAVRPDAVPAAPSAEPPAGAAASAEAPASQALPAPSAPQAHPAAVPAAVAPARPVEPFAARTAKPSSDSPGSQAQGNNGQSMRKKSAAAASPRGKAKKNDAGAGSAASRATAASVAEAAATAGALEAAARELSSTQRLRTESSRPGVGVKQMMKNTSRVSDEGNGAGYRWRHAAKLGTSWLQKFRH